MVTILQHPIATDFIYPFALMFFILFGVLQKTKIFGDKKMQLDALISAVVSLIFVSSVFSKVVVGDLMLFLVVGMIIVFVALMLWGFVGGKGEFGGGTKKFLGWLIGIALFIAVLWVTGFGGGLQKIFTNIFGFLFTSSWSGDVWTNFFFIAFIIIAVVVVLKVKK